jgi:siderophore synthetase component
MYKIRRSIPPLPEYGPGEYDFLQPKLRFVSLVREEVKITYDFENLILPLFGAARARAGRPFDMEDDRIIIPVHELQIYHIRDKIETAIIFPEEFSLPLLAQQSLR